MERKERMSGTVVAPGVAVLLAFAGASDLLAADWPVFHGPRRDNKSTETGLLKSWPEVGPRLLWKATGIGTGYSSVTVSRGMLYTAGMVEGKTWVFAFDLGGDHKWKAVNGASWRAPGRMRWAAKYAGSRATPTIEGGVVYHLGCTGRLAAWNARTGDEVWSLNVAEAFDARIPKYGYSESVFIDGGNLIVCPAGKKAYMVALDKKTREVVWKMDEVQEPVGFSTPVPAEFGGFRQLVTVSAKSLISVDAKTGRLLWTHPHANKRGNNVTDPVFDGDIVYASTGYGGGSVALRLKKAEGGLSVEKAWSSELLDNHHGGVVLHEGHVFGSGHEQKGWFCLELKTGAEKARGEGKGSLTYADGMLYCLDEKGTMSLVEAKPGEWKVVSSFKVPSGGGGMYWAHPVVCGGRLYVRHADALYCYDVRGRR